MSWFAAKGASRAQSVALNSTEEKTIGAWTVVAFNRVCLAIILRERMDGAVVACVGQHLGRTGECDHQVFFQSAGS